MPTPWIVSNIVLCILVLIETALLILLLRALGRLRQECGFSGGRVADRISGGLPVGMQAPLITGTDQQGRTVSLNDTKGSTRILAFISPGCAACAGAISALNNVLASDPDVTVLLVSGSDSAANRAYAAEHHLGIPLLTPRPGRGKEVYRVEGVPFVFMIDGAGVIRAAGVVNGDEEMQRLLSTAQAAALVHSS